MKALILSGFCASSSSRVMWWLCRSEWLWPQAVTGDPLLWLLGYRWNGLPHVPVYINATPFSQKGVRKPPGISDLVSIGSIVYFCILTWSFILSYLVAVFLVADEIDPTFCSSGNLWSTLISFGSQGAWWIKDDVVHICSGLNILVFDSFVYLSLFSFLVSRHVCMLREEEEEEAGITV